MPTPQDQEAAAAIRAHHAELHATLRERVIDLQSAVRAPDAPGSTAREAARQALLGYLDGELLPHAIAEEQALYPAGDSGLTALLVRAMREEHVGLIGRVERLREAADGYDAALLSGEILALFESHLWKENELLVPALLADANVSISVLLDGMHQLVG